MLLKRNLLENLTFISSSGTILCILLNYVTNVSLLTGIWFPLYVISLFIVSVLLSFKSIQWLLSLNKPLKYDLEDLVAKYPYLAILKRYLPEVKKRAPEEWKEYDTNDLSVISTVLERNLVSSWYLPYVSQDIGFPFACKQMLDQMIGKAFKICYYIETKDVFTDLCTIVITHLKEYKKALKRHEKTPNCTIESLYKMSHLVSDTNNKYTTADHCTNILRMLVKELLPCELWDTPHSELLVRILSKKLDTYIENTLADPAWINDRIIAYLTDEENVENVEKDNVNAKEEVQEVPEKGPVVESEIQHIEVAEELTAQEDVAKMESIVEEVPVNATPPLDIKSSPVLRQKRGRQGRNEVKIYDRIIEGSVKTWETDMDLQCISLGQDLLASLNGEITLSRLWGQEGEPEGSPERPGGKSPLPLWFGEEEALELEGAAPRREHSPKAADVLKELHSTVSHAKTKIGDLQVRPPEHSLGDEAAGMMEGLLDFGIAGLKKGLRFTGLSDDSQDKSPMQREKSNRSSPEARHKPYPELAPSPLVNKADADNGGVGTAPHLVKQHRVTSQDSVPVGIPAGSTVEGYGGSESPEPQYEEAADLSSSIAKLRCLLRQRADPAPPREEVWWEGAEETRGRAQHHPSSRPVDTATLADEYDMSLERNASPGNVGNNNMQRLDKLFQRTVTGVFNSLKTAVGGEEGSSEPGSGASGASGGARSDWDYVCGAGELGAGAAAARLLARAAARSRAPSAPPRRAPLPRLRTCEADDLEECVCGGAWGAVLGAACAVHAAPHAAARLATLLLADVTECVISWWLCEVSANLRRLAFEAAGRGSAVQRRAPRWDHALDLIMERTTALQVVFGEATVRSAAETALASVSQREVNRDLAYRAVDLLALHFRAAADTCATQA